MPYLTHDEYKELGFSDVEASEFNSLLKRASDVIDSVTSSFYYFNDLETDVPFRRDRFKKAIAAQIEYFHDMGSVNSHGLKEPATVTIGRTSMGAGVQTAQNGAQGVIVSDDAVMYLKDTGLLYRGIGVM